MNSTTHGHPEDHAGPIADMADSVAAEYRSLLADLQDLVERAQRVEDPNLAPLIDRIRNTLLAARSALGAGAKTLRNRTGEAAVSTDALVRDNAWAAIGIAALLGAAVGYLATRRE